MEQTQNHDNTTTNKRDYLKTFFEERDLPIQNWEIEGEWGTNYISSDVVIESILGTQGEERKRIEKIVRELDYKNGNFYHFLKYLAEVLVI